MYGVVPSQLGPVQAQADSGGVSGECGRVYVEEGVWQLDAEVGTAGLAATKLDVEE